MPTLPISIQLYTVRDLTRTDMAGTLKEIAKIGYKYVELAGLGNLTSVGDLRKALDAAGLKVSGWHAGIESLEKDPTKVMDENDAVGNKILIVPHLAESRRKNADDWKQFSHVLAKIAADVKARGFELAYHNHDFEFKTFDGKAGLDILFDNDSSGLVKSELDVYWVKRGGQDPVTYIDKLNKRILLLHLKDVASGAEPNFAPVGAGTLDFPAIVAAGVKAGAKFGVVEQDNTYSTPPLDAIKTSLANLKKMGLAG